MTKSCQIRCRWLVLRLSGISVCEISRQAGRFGIAKGILKPSLRRQLAEDFDVIGRFICRALFCCCALVFGSAFALGLPSSKPIPALATFLDENGVLALPEGYAGGIDPSGYRMVAGPGDDPRFISVDQHSSDPRWKGGFHLPHGCDGSVFAMAVGNDGGIYFGGSFIACGSEIFNSIVRYDPVSDAWSGLGSSGGRGVNGSVHALLFVGDDLYVGGRFDEVNHGEPVPARNIARWNGAGWSSVGDGLGADDWDTVFALASFDSSLVAAGSFEYTGGDASVRASHIARWSANAWVPLGASGGVGLSSVVRALVVHDGQLHAGGFFQSANVGNDVPASLVARWDGAAWTGLPGGINSMQGHEVAALASHAGQLYVGGSFYHVIGGGYARNLVRWDGSDWSPVGSVGANGTNGRVSVLHSTVDGLYVGGGFAKAAIGNSANSGIWADGLARWDGQQWTAVTYLPYLTDGAVISLVSLDGELFVGAGIVDRPGSPRVLAAHLARVGASGVSRLGENSGAGIGGQIKAMLVHDDDLYVAGDLVLMSRPEASHVAKWDGSAWQNLLTSRALSPNSFNEFRALAFHGDQLYVGGLIDSIQGRPMNGLARWDGNRWHDVGGGVQAPFLHDGMVYALLAGSDGSLYVGGSFQIAGGLVADGFAVWNEDAWTVPASETAGIDGTPVVLSIVEFQGEIHVAGNLAGAYFNGARSIASWDGAHWSSVPQRDIDDYVEAMAVHDGGLYAGGFFSQVGLVSPVAARNIARWDGLGWQALGGTGDGVDGGVSVLASAGQDLYVAGTFTSAQVGTLPVPSPGIVRWDGDSWNAMGAGLAPRLEYLGYTLPNANALAVDGSLLYMGGIIRLADGQPSSTIAAYQLRGDLLFADGFEIGESGLGREIVER